MISTTGNPIVLRSAALLATAALVSACASQPIVDTQGKSMAQYEQDLADCRDYAKQVRAGQKVAVGAVAGAAVGAVIGAAVGNSDTAARGAAVGATSGTVRGTGSALHERERVVFNCLRHRGYAVLNY